MVTEVEEARATEQRASYNFLDNDTFFSSENYKGAVKEFYGFVLHQKGLDLGEPANFWEQDCEGLETIVNFGDTLFYKIPHDEKGFYIGDKGREEIFFGMVKPLSCIEGGILVSRKEEFGGSEHPHISLLGNMLKLEYSHHPLSSSISFSVNYSEKERRWKTIPKDFFELLRALEEAFGAFNGVTDQLRTNAVITYLFEEKEIGGFKLNGMVGEYVIPGFKKGLTTSLFIK